MKCKIAICDDNPADQAYIAELLRRWGEARHAAPELRMFRSAEQFLFQYAEEKDFHILILDIEMEQMNGVELAKTLRREDRALQILRSKLYEEEVSKQNASIAAERKSQIGSGDRSERVRTYNFPQDRVTDHRIGLTQHNIQGFMDGDLDSMIDALTNAAQAERLRAGNAEES